MNSRSPFSFRFSPLILIFFTLLNLAIVLAESASAQNTPPTLLPLGQKKVSENQLLTFLVTATDPDVNDTLTLRASRLPSGATFVDNGNRTGTFSWRPASNQSGVYKSTFFTVSDGTASDTEFAYIIVTNVNRPPVLDPINDHVLNEEERLTFQIRATDPDARDIITLSATNLPPGATFVDQSGGYGLFDWTPARGQTGIYTVTFIAANPGERLSRYGSDSDSVFIAVKDITPPAISNIFISGYGPNYVTVSWSTDDLASSQVDYGTTSGYGQTTQLDMNLTRTHSVTLPELTWATQYHFRVRSHNVFYLVSESGDQIFTTANRAPSLVTTSGRQILVQKRNLNGTLAPAEPYFIRGVNWSPASVETNSPSPDIRRSEFKKWYPTDIPLFQGMNVNTIRTFFDLGTDAVLGPEGIKILDELYRRGIMVVMTVDEGANNLTRIDSAVNYYKNHPAVLLWSLGSEWSINHYFGISYSSLDSANRTQTATQRVKLRDTQHPVVSSYGNILGNTSSNGDEPDFEMLDYFVNTICPAVDIWSFNEYRGHGFSFLFDRWSFISTKPMFLGEFGIDAYDSRIGNVNQTTQAEWNLGLWNEIVWNQQSGVTNFSKITSGGFVFEWNDEWWKTPPAGQPDPGGWEPEGFPDGHASEDYWGIVEINRNPRQTYNSLQIGFDPAYRSIAPSQTRLFTAISAGATSGSNFAKFRENGSTFYFDRGASFNGARGFNVAAINPITGHLLYQVQNFDTWNTRYAGTEMNRMIAFLDSLPGGTIILIAVGDEAGINTTGGSCAKLSSAWMTAGIAKLKELGSTMIDDYCYWDSWSMIVMKNIGVRSEQLSHTDIATAETTIQFP